MQIGYDDGDRDDLRIALYFQIDLGNDGVKSNPGYVNLMQPPRRRRLLPEGRVLPSLRRLFLQHPRRHSRQQRRRGRGRLRHALQIFRPREWDVTPYGNYTGPINLFKEHNQPDLAAFYAKNVPSPLPFGTGYKFVSNQSSILVARKKN